MAVFHPQGLIAEEVLLNLHRLKQLLRPVGHLHNQVLGHLHRRGKPVISFLEEACLLVPLHILLEDELSRGAEVVALLLRDADSWGDVKIFVQFRLETQGEGYLHGFLKHLVKHLLDALNH